jgi:hypothetical protein
MGRTHRLSMLSTKNGRITDSRERRVKGNSVDLESELDRETWREE